MVLLDWVELIYVGPHFRRVLDINDRHMLLGAFFHVEGVSC
jgi:hypothetical protein